MEQQRCDWANSSELERKYHDEEWGTAEHNDRKLFELLLLESMQAGLSWSTILKKRDSLAQAYDQFDYEKIALYEKDKVAELLNNPGVIRNKLKVNAAITNAQLFMAIQKEYGSFDRYIWSYVEDVPIKNNWQTIQEVPASTDLSDRISKALKKRGFKFVGTTIVYSYMQSIGMVNDHLVTCFKRTMNN